MNASIDDKIYIGGLYGEDFDYVNQKIGLLKKITCYDINNSINYIGEVLINNNIIPINLRYLYKLEKDIDIDPILLSDTMLEDLFFELDIYKYTLSFDETNQSPISVCLTRDDKSFFLSTGTLN